MPPQRCHYLALPSEPSEPSELRCNNRCLRIVGDCPRCPGSFCGTHRLPEHHDCPGMADCRQEAFDKNKERLESERTVAAKIAG